MGWLIGLNLLLFLSVGTLPAIAEPLVSLEEQHPSPTAQEFFREGVAAFEADNLNDALNYFSRAIQINAEYTNAYSNRCLTHIQLENYDQAIADCNQVIQQQPNNTEAFLNRGLAWYRLGEYDAAIADYTQLLHITPYDPRAYYNRGLARAEQFAYREAIVDYGEALRQVALLDPTTAALVYTDRGVAHLLLKQYPSAIADFTHTIQLSPDDTRALFNRGCAYYQQGNMLPALNDFNQVTILDPQFAEAYLQQGLIQHQLGEPSKANRSLQQAATSFWQQGLLSRYHATQALIKQLQWTTTAFG